MKKRTFLPFILVFLVITNMAFSQGDASKRNNNIKINLLALPFRNVAVQYERSFHKNLSGALNFRLMPSIGLPSSVADGDATGNLANFKMKGYAITPELRFYPGKKVKRQAPRGFYLAPAVRYSHFDFTLPVTFEDNADVNHDLIVKGKMNGLGGGLMMGCQWVIKNRVSIDWWILGGHYGSMKTTVSVQGDMAGYSQEDKDALIKEFNDMQIPNGEVKAAFSGDSFSVNAKMPFVGLRSGLAIGIVF